MQAFSSQSPAAALGLSRTLTVRMGAPAASVDGGPMATRAVLAAVHAHMPTGNASVGGPSAPSPRIGGSVRDSSRGPQPAGVDSVSVTQLSPRAGRLTEMPRDVLTGSDSWKTRGVTSPRMSDRAAHFSNHISAEEAMLPPAQRAYVAASATGLARVTAAGVRARSVGRFRETETGFHPDTHVQVWCGE
jgi:hypothetical protein